MEIKCKVSFALPDELMGIIVGDKQFGILLSGVKPLGNIRDACGGLDHNSFLGVQLPNFGTVIVREEELAFDLH